MKTLGLALFVLTVAIVAFLAGSRYDPPKRVDSSNDQQVEMRAVPLVCATVTPLLAPAAYDDYQKVSVTAPSGN